MKPLRLGLVSMHTSPASEPGAGDAGGMNVVVLEQARQLAEAGHIVDLITRRSGEGPESIEIAPRLGLRRIAAGPAVQLAKGEHESHMEAFRLGISALGPYELLHSHHWFSGMAALPVARGRGIPHVQSFHSIAAPDTAPHADGERAESPGRCAGEQQLARQSDAVIAVSEYEAEVARSRLGAPPGSIAVVAPGVDTALFRPIEGARERPGYVIAAGRIHPLKGLELAIDALALLPTPTRPRLVVAGEASGDLTAYAAALRERARLRGVVAEFPGPQHRRRLAVLFAGARALLVPSHSETFGLVALEAAAAETPVLASTAGGLPEAVGTSDTGILIDSRDPTDWARALDGLLTDDAFAARIGRAARARALEFTWQRSADRLLNGYRGVLQMERMDP